MKPANRQTRNQLPLLPGLATVVAVLIGFAIILQPPTAYSQKYSVIHAFTGGRDGEGAYAGLTLDAAANLYGVAQGGGTSRQGVVFKFDASGHETVLYNFSGPRCGATGTLSARC